MTRTAPLALALGTLLLAPLAAPAAGEADIRLEDVLSTASLVALGLLPGAGEDLGGADAGGRITTSAAAQNEPAVAVNPTDPTNVLAAWNDYDTAASGAGVWTGIGTSHDGGATWNARILGPSPKSVPAPVKRVFREAGIPFTYAGDPVLGFNAAGVGLAGGLVFDSFTSSALYVQATGGPGSVAGDHFGPPILTAWSGVNVPVGLTDKPWMRGDLAGKNFYQCWTHFAGSIQIHVTASHDGFGLTWTNPVQVSTENGVQGCDIGIEPDGTVHIVYYDFGFGLTGGGPMKIATSEDGGLTWTAPRTIGVAAPLGLPNSAFRYNQFARVAVDPTSGALYVVWTEGSGDVVLTKSTDGGMTWSAKKVVNNDGTGRAQFFPAIDVGPDGKVVVGFYDRREDTANRVAKYYFAESTDGGATFPVQYAANGATIDGLNTTHWFMGDYTDLRIGKDGRIHAVFTVTPNGNQDVYTNA